MSGQKMKLLICDDSADARAALRVMLATPPRIEIVGEAGDGEEAVALALECRPDVVLMDVAMPRMDGIAATRRICELLPGTRVVAYAGTDDTATVSAMIQAGASAYCVKGAPLWELERALADASDPLVRLARALARAVDGEGTADLVTRELAELTGATAAATYLAAADAGLALAALAGDASAERLASAPNVVLRADADSALVRADDTELDELHELGVDAAAAVAAPLVFDGSPLGALLVMVDPAGSRIDEEVVAAVADLAAAALAKARRFAATFAEARRDALTGLGNKRAFDEHVDRLLRDRVPFGLALCDLDDFKQVNDREGHLVGDKVLRAVSRAILRSLRAEEEAFRVGGEEFALVVRGDAVAAAAVAERVRETVHGHRRGPRLPTLSAGIAAFPVDAESKEQLLDRADSALYTAKRAGKNRAVAYSEARHESGDATGAAPARATGPMTGLRVLVVDDDAGLRALLRTTFDVVDIDVAEADSAPEALRSVAARVPDVIVLDVSMPGMDGLALCRSLKQDRATGGIGVVLLTGSEQGTEAAARAAGADAFLRKPFSPLELLGVVERVAAGVSAGGFRGAWRETDEEQLLIYAQDFRKLYELERGQRALLQRAYRETVGALATALESKDTGTGMHSQRVQRYALELAVATDARLAQDPSLEYGFLLHDVGKIGIPDRILGKRAPLLPAERRLMESHTVLGEQLLGGVALLQGEGLRVVRSHHERWDGAGYPDRLAGSEIPLSARVFAVADALDAMTSDRPYRAARPWEDAVAEVMAESGRQFDPDVVGAFREREPVLRSIHRELVAA